MSRFFLRLLNYILLACFLSSIWGGWYLSKQGFGRKWRKKLSEEFAKRGVELTARRLTLDPLRGLVARNVQVYRDGDHEETVAIIDELHLDINYTRLLRNEPFLDALILSEAEVLLDVDPLRKKSGEFTIHHLTAQLYFQQDKLEIRRLQGEGLGLHFSISGVLEHRPDWQAMAHSGNFWQPLQKIPQRWLKALAEIDFGRKKGRLDLRFRGNLSQKRWLQSANAHLVMPEATWRGISLQELHVEGDYADRLLTVRRFKWRDDQGAIAISGNWRPDLEGHLLVDSKIDLLPIFTQAKVFPEWAGVGKMQLHGDLSWRKSDAPDWQFVGNLAADKLVYREVSWDRVETRFSLTPQRWFFQELNLQQKSGAVTGQFLSDRGRVTAEICSTVDPHSLWQTAHPPTPTWLDDFDFAVNPYFKFLLKSDPKTPGGLLTEGEVIFGRTSFRGVSLTSAQAVFKQSKNNLSFDWLQITRPEGQLTGTAFLDLDKSCLTIWNVQNSLDLVALGLWTDRALADVLETVELPKNTHLEGGGVVCWKNSQLAKIDLQLNSPSLAIAEIPLFSSLAKRVSSSPSVFAGRILLENGLLKVEPFSAHNKESTIEGSFLWNLTTRKFSGSLQIQPSDGDAVSWLADSPMQEILWRKPPPNP